ncbi:nuclease-related domain-containing protein [Marinobacterium mangrovicola]|uniref:Nuclease-like protein n=1 Tax=Marinobacterium mangrovicola TaxID=1476959 RepID=A0A4R1GFG6_9GAMM|nr:nuclease-related domain-containing protein [Marinobacterium mangrovicola]TCK02952.1 nuclease-like protein [Marinobacterium mangrovicola]
MPIVTSKQDKAFADVRQVAGDKQERDVAFYLRRAFKDREDIYVFNDYAFRYKGENAQIDHLIVHKYGFMLLESKSIYGEVKVNSTGEWSRSYKGLWSGIASPIKQAELQQKLLKQMLSDNVEQFLGKMLLGIQQGVGGRKWDTLCVVSNSCILHRDNIPSNINAQIIKSEAVAEAVEKVGGKGFLKAFIDTSPAFSKEELEQIVEHLLKQTASAPELRKTPSAPEEPNAPEPAEPVQPAPVVDSNASRHLKCKKCGEANRLTGCYGKYGYYVKCDLCGTNTSMRIACTQCGGTDVKITKNKNQYWANCACSEPVLLFKQSNLGE